MGGKRILLNFEAVDHDTNVWVNDIFVGSIREALIAFHLILQLS